ncbi:hypothetical protein [Flammeovirga sp. SJP92]|uniref:hypothetical protein n=1 Tax=Flammeovirga sp. SJP92 TaxID=1775430 RepID=UPI0007881174|nr:hypothetical protein [Flammeovirga sp. SJP92]KXX70612.1 hypothetical protein AVL50_07260 [Flammeovirga sp. SJP92]
MKKKKIRIYGSSTGELIFKTPAGSRKVQDIVKEGTIEFNSEELSCTIMCTTKKVDNNKTKWYITHNLKRGNKELKEWKVKQGTFSPYSERVDLEIGADVDVVFN